MKLLLTIPLAFILFVGCTKKTDTETAVETETASDTSKLEINTSYSNILFEETSYEFGKIKQGEVIAHTFIFKNDSKEPLIVSNASASCGCTIPVWPKDAINPGESGKIEVQFNSTGKSGIQNKTIAITANTMPSTTTLVLKGEVEAPVVVEEKAK